jgi:hypothetical protein
LGWIVEGEKVREGMGRKFYSVVLMASRNANYSKRKIKVARRV